MLSVSLRVSAPLRWHQLTHPPRPLISMSFLVHVAQCPVGVARALGSRIWFAAPGVAGALAAYSYFPHPTKPGVTQNIAGMPCECVMTGLHDTETCCCARRA